ncbi:hypothetical protein R50073_48410 [Maricurvus nonylphenolicus]|uniref:TfoX/Sxy family protein n=1 Tax=Maricurvus nonylphenolicus TaxID=1008307 RepID=UPI0036F29368
MAVSEHFINRVVGTLSHESPIRVQRLFDGAGLYIEDQFFGLVVDDQLYFHTTPATRDRYLKAGMEPFRPYGDDGKCLQFYRVPDQIVSCQQDLCDWMNYACDRVVEPA